MCWGRQVPTVLIARTDADSASLLTSDIDEADRAFCTGERTPEGFFKIREGIEVRTYPSHPMHRCMYFVVRLVASHNVGCLPPFAHVVERQLHLRVRTALEAEATL